MTVELGGERRDGDSEVGRGNGGRVTVESGGGKEDPMETYISLDGMSAETVR